MLSSDETFNSAIKGASGCVGLAGIVALTQWFFRVDRLVGLYGVLMTSIIEEAELRPRHADGQLADYVLPDHLVDRLRLLQEQSSG